MCSSSSMSGIRHAAYFYKFILHPPISHRPGIGAPSRSLYCLSNKLLASAKREDLIFDIIHSALALITTYSRDTSALMPGADEALRDL